MTSLFKCCSSVFTAVSLSAFASPSSPHNPRPWIPLFCTLAVCVDLSFCAGTFCSTGLNFLSYKFIKALAIGLVLLPSFVAIAMSVRRLIASHIASLKTFDCVSCLFEVICRFPSCLLISFPLHPVLDPVPLDLFVKDCFDFVFFLTFDDVQQWLVLELLPWEKVGYCPLKDIVVEYWVDPGLWWKLKFV